VMAILSPLPAAPFILMFAAASVTRHLNDQHRELGPDGILRGSNSRGPILAGTGEPAVDSDHARTSDKAAAGRMEACDLGARVGEGGASHGGAEPHGDRSAGWLARLGARDESQRSDRSIRRGWKRRSSP
jgi:hypothetical protein